MERRRGIDSSMGAIGLMVVLLVIGTIIFSCSASVSVGNAGLLIDPIFGGGVSKRPIIGPKWFLKSPLQSMKTIRYTMAFLIFSDTEDSADYGTILCFSSEGIELEMDITVRYSVNPDKLYKLYESYPSLNWEHTTISSVSMETIRFVVKNYGWQEVRDQRDTVAYEIEDAIRAAIANENSLSEAIINIEVDLKNIGIPAVLLNEVNSKVAAEQAVITAEYRRNAMLIEANATAQAQLIDARADAESRRLRAIGERQAIEEIINLVGPDGWESFYRMQKLKEIAETLDNGEAMVILPIDTIGKELNLILNNQN